MIAAMAMMAGTAVEQEQVQVLPEMIVLVQVQVLAARALQQQLQALRLHPAVRAALLFSEEMQVPFTSPQAVAVAADTLAAAADIPAAVAADPLMLMRLLLLPLAMETSAQVMAMAM